MTIAELLPTLHALPRREKLRVIQELVAAMEQEDEALVMGAASETVWAPYEAYGAATALLNVLAKDQTEAK